MRYWIHHICVAALLAAAGVIITATAACADTWDGDYCRVQYTGIDAPYARAIARVYDCAHEGYKYQFSLKLPESVTINITTGAYATRLYTDGERSINLDLASADDLHPNRGYFHIYGICQQAGLISLYSRMSSTMGLPDGVGPGWGHYCGSVVTDYVWEELGSDVWPGGWDYSKDGTARLEYQCRQYDKDATTAAACVFMDLGRRHGHQKIGRVMGGALGVKPSGEELMGRFCKGLDARIAPGTSQLIPDGMRKSPIVPKGELIILPAHVAPSDTQWTDENGFTGYDDDDDDGMRSVAGSGHIIKFNVEGGGELRQVRIKGARYGNPTSDSSFTLTVYDASFKVVQYVTQPYMLFAIRGEPLYWVDVNLGKVEVTEEFYIALDFDPAQTDGIYLGYDADSTGHSYLGRDMYRTTDFSEGDWMVRVRVE